MSVTRVFDLDAGEWGPIYTLSPREAVIAAYAQSLGDWNTWDYEARYGHLVHQGDHVIVCGPFSAKKRNPRRKASEVPT